MRSHFQSSWTSTQTSSARSSKRRQTPKWCISRSPPKLSNSSTIRPTTQCCRSLLMLCSKSTKIFKRTPTRVLRQSTGPTKVTVVSLKGGGAEANKKLWLSKPTLFPKDGMKEYLIASLCKTKMTGWTLSSTWCSNKKLLSSLRSWVGKVLFRTRYLPVPKISTNTTNNKFNSLFYPNIASPLWTDAKPRTCNKWSLH